jgi:hypothetical protein
MTPEGKTKEAVKKLFKRFGIYYHMPVMNGMGAPTLDFIACAWGYFIAVETKAPGKKPTQRQTITMADMGASGAFVFVVSDSASLAMLEATLTLLRPA